MTSTFRSEEMSFCDMYLHADDAFECVNRLGELGICQFKDMNVNMNAFQRHFVSEIRNLEEMERIIRYFTNELKKDEMKYFDESFQEDQAAMSSSLNDMIAKLESREKELKELGSNFEELEKNHNELIELSNVLNKTTTFFEDGVYDVDVINNQSTRQPIYQPINQSTNQPIRYTAGVMPVNRVFGFTRLLYFATRGASFLRTADIDGQIRDPATGDIVNKCVFMVVCSGQQLHSKIRKIAEGFHATLYPCPDNLPERERMMDGVRQRLIDLEMILDRSREQREQTLRIIARNLKSWKVKVVRLKACYHMLNMFRYERGSFVGQCWLPTSYLARVQNLLNVSNDRASNIINPIPSSSLPTYHKSNSFTMAFQAIIDAYGIATYKEVNPAIFSIITFPFLFSVMFGDAGHGLLMLLFALYLCLNQRSLATAAEKNEIFSIVFGGRYMILLMSLFSIYSGFMYNDVFSRSVAFVPSSWKVVYDEQYLEKYSSSMLDPSNKTVFQNAYPFGIDPVWKSSSNQITFTNSYKKKLSIVFGVAQMLLGIFLGLCNHIYFKKYLNIICDFIPMLLFLLSLFGYLTALIIAKWAIFYEGSSFYDCSPNLLIGFINMFLMSYPAPADDKQCDTIWFTGQKELQITLVVVAVVCAVWLLLGKPLILLAVHKYNTTNSGHQRLVEESPSSPSSRIDFGSDVRNRRSSSLADRDSIDVLNSHGSGNRDVLNSHNSATSGELDGISKSRSDSVVVVVGGDDVHHEKFDFGDIMVHQAIHTIEFCLGCISHTASYLRLWALSLAHAQLSEVLWTMVMRIGLKLGAKWVNSVVIFLTFAPFATLTVVILILMEGLSAFLHTLRLHWVEFNSKFYDGNGLPFDPFCFEKIMKNVEG
ncbi:hypothetical protein HELRODRAFT_100933 [Helobdella robusta]|uniref:V-type proton ATPase subunit a n=1 Tax=Helobdella robusta TaxID=6412 RepID=T1ED21_HELRO|nr:hypothetical protein HELRODRAFT_100933 [Helobdella robusta]ESO00949.1 hypothetical protein HELRODRAFT_100933 [Helobdella robusta]